MRNIILAVVAILALTVAGMGGTLATWSDSETSLGNTITTGSVDLKVNGADDIGPSLDDPKWGQGVPTKVDIDCMIPCKLYGPYEFELWNAGQCEFPSHAYMHLKDVCCSNAPPKLDEDDKTTGYRCPETGDLKPEPELVAEFGGKVNCLWVDGIGEAVGDTCSMASHVKMWVIDEEQGLGYVPEEDDPVALYEGKLGTFECEELYLFDLMPCEPRTIYLWFHLQQESEEDYGFNYFANPGEVGYNELEWLKFNDWPSWSMMKDKIQFSLEFDLWLVDP